MGILAKGMGKDENYSVVKQSLEDQPLLSIYMLINPFVSQH